MLKTLDGDTTESKRRNTRPFWIGDKDLVEKVLHNEQQTQSHKTRETIRKNCTNGFTWKDSEKTVGVNDSQNLEYSPDSDEETHTR